MSVRVGGGRERGRRSRLRFFLFYDFTFIHVISYLANGE